MTEHDQAATLRALKGSNVVKFPTQGKSISVSGGKGGIGKSMFAVNLAAAFGARGDRTVILDGDLGMADLNLLLGVAPDKSVLDLLQGAATDDVLVETHGLHFLPGLNGSHQLANVERSSRALLLEKISTLATKFDRVVIDTAAGIEKTAMTLAASATHIVVVATPEPLSLADGYAALKVLSTHYGRRQAHLLPNNVRSKVEADRVIEQLTALAKRFLDIELTPLPYIPHDPLVPLAAAAGCPLVLQNPDAPASRSITRIARIFRGF